MGDNISSLDVYMRPLIERAVEVSSISFEVSKRMTLLFSIVLHKASWKSKHLCSSMRIQIFSIIPGRRQIWGRPKRLNFRLRLREWICLVLIWLTVRLEYFFSIIRKEVPMINQAEIWAFRSWYPLLMYVGFISRASVDNYHKETGSFSHV